jgi:hypothetical protein
VSAISPLQLDFVEESEAAPATNGRIIIGFILFELTCATALLFPTLAPLRIFFRTAAFGGSAVLLFALARTKPPHRSSKAALVVLASVAIFGLLMPGSSLLAKVATVAMNLAILGPIFWATQAPLGLANFRRVILTFWSFHTASSIFGYLQVHYPGSFLPSMGSVHAGDRQWLDAMTITLANGEHVFRPMGLTDAPGGAAVSGLYTVIFSVGLLLTERKKWMQSLAVGSMGLGLFCIYLSQVRSVLVMVAVAVLAMLAALAGRKEVGRLLSVTIIVGAVCISSLVWAIAVGGQDTVRRLSTLIESSPVDVYYSNRGRFIEYGFTTELGQYPFGAGAGRWGMMNTYFGDPVEMIWSEVIWTSWLLDGGLVMVIAYGTAVLVAILFAWKVARIPGLIGLWGAAVFAYDMAVLAQTFNSNVFMSELGLQFWLLNASLAAVYYNTTVQPQMIPE